MNTKSFSILIIFLVLLGKTNGQNSYQIGGLPSVNVNYKLKNDYSLNSKIESRKLIQKVDFNGVTLKKNDYLLTDISVLFAKKINLNKRVSAGYLLRVDDKELYHRFIQQFVILQKTTHFRFSHRFLVDETLSKVEALEIRIRYRISSEIPLNGNSIDTKEFYLKINNEYLNSFQDNKHDLEVRFVPLIGLDLNKNFKIETGLDYRINSFLKDKTNHNTWLCLSIFVEF